VPTDKRQRQKAGRQARLAAEQKVRKRRQSLRRVVTVAIVIAIVVGLSILIFKPGKKSTSATTTTSPTAFTTSADCPSALTAPLHKPSYKSVPPTTIDPSKTYTATVTTDVGPFTIQLDPKSAPISTNSFVYLANHHFFDCIVFHRVIPGFVDQTGDPTGTGSGGPGYQFAEPGPAKANPQYPLGSVAMANSNNPATTDPNTNGSQFFVVTGSQGETLMPDYTLFGQVTSGMDVVQKINADGAASGTPTKLHRMISVTIAES
jgi:cyclophilin family peptidyl-prolyl cis-trans isomerase